MLKEECDALSNTGLKCFKKNHLSQEGVYYEHAGGHFFSTEKAWKILDEDHIDATAFLSGQPVRSHKPEECDGTDFCSWRIKGKDY